MESVSDHALSAFRRLLAEASHGGQAKVDAIVALSQRTVRVATWMPTHDGFRTIVNSMGQAALPVFTDMNELRRAAQRFDWVLPDGSVPSQELGAREALRYIMSQDLAFIVVDIASEHAMEIERAEVEPLLTTLARRNSTGPFAAVGRISSSMLEAVGGAAVSSGRQSSTHGAVITSGSVPNFSGTLGPEDPTLEISVPATRPTSSTSQQMAQVVSRPADEIHRGRQSIELDAPGPQRVSITGDPGIRIEALAPPPSDELLADLSDFLRDYPEVEWAAIFSVTRSGLPRTPAVGLRVDAGYRSRVNELEEGLRGVGEFLETRLDVVFLDDPGLVRQARGEALVFFPWMPKPRA